jgi:hypothetical protein
MKDSRKRSGWIGISGSENLRMRAACNQRSSPILLGLRKCRNRAKALTGASPFGDEYIVRNDLRP